MSKRARTDSGYSSAQRKAMAINASINKRYPYSTYGRAYHKRGTEANLNRYGATFKSADPMQRQLRKHHGYVGRGAYWGKALGKWAGGTTGIPGAAKLGGFLGDKASDWAAKKWSGRGLYQGRGSYNNLISGGDMSMSGSGNETESVTFSNREYIKDIYGPDDSKFHNEVLSLNAGLENTFPWLAQVACNYEEYEFIQLVFEYKSTVNASTAGDGQTGTVIMATNYNASEKPFEDKAAMMQYHGGQSARLTDDMAHGVECDPSKSVGDMHKYVRCDPVKDDIKSYDHGKFNLAIANLPSEFQNQQVGELWVSYTVKLLKPRLGAARMVNQQIDRFGIQGTTSAAVTIAADGILNLFPQSFNPFAYTSNNIGCMLAETQDNRDAIVFPATLTGTFEIVVRFMTAYDADGATEDLSRSFLDIEGGISGNGIERDYSVILHSDRNLEHTNDVPTPTDTGTTLRKDWQSHHTEMVFNTVGGNTVSVSNCAITCTFRVNLKAASGGLDNIFRLNLKNRNVSACSVTRLAAFIEVREIKRIEDDSAVLITKENVTVQFG